MTTLFKQPLFYLFLSSSFIFMVHAFPLPYFMFPEYTFYFGLVFLLLGTMVLLVCLALFFKNQLKCGIDSPVDFLVDGVYHYSRNPDYMSIVITLIGTALMTLNPIALLAPLVYFQLANKWFIPWKERRMLGNHGSNYMNFQTKVRRWI